MCHTHPCGTTTSPNIFERTCHAFRGWKSIPVVVETRERTHYSFNQVHERTNAARELYAKHTCKSVPAHYQAVISNCILYICYALASCAVGYDSQSICWWRLFFRNSCTIRTSPQHTHTHTQINTNPLDREVDIRHVFACLWRRDARTIVCRNIWIWFVLEYRFSARSHHTATASGQIMSEKHYQKTTLRYK